MVRISGARRNDDLVGEVSYSFQKNLELDPLESRVHKFEVKKGAHFSRPKREMP